MIAFEQARDEIFGLFVAAWNAGTSSIVGYVPEVRYQGVEVPSLPDSSKFWCRISKQTVTEGQGSLSNCESLPGQFRYTASGLVFVQLFCPKSETRAWEFGQLLSKVARNAFRGKKTTGGVWFVNTRIVELSPEDLYYRFNVVTEFEYDEIG